MLINICNKDIFYVNNESGGSKKATYFVDRGKMYTSKKLLIVLTLFMFSLLIFSFVLADDSGVDDKGNPNDPSVNENANACFIGGSMEGKCNSDSNGDGIVTQEEIDWAWTCGWYVIRLDPQNEESRAAFPIGCVSLLPPLIREDVAKDAAKGAPAACYTDGKDSIRWTGGIGPKTVETYFGTTCSGTIYLQGIVWGATKADAQAICPYTISDFGAGAPAAGGKLYFCQ